MKFTRIVLAVFLFSLATSLSWGHATRGFTDKFEGIRVKAEFDDGEAMSYSAVEVTAPDSDTVFQTGRTDRNGVFMFAPDQPGKWRIAVSDEMGHRLVLGRQVEPETEAAIKSSSARQTESPLPSRREGIVAGLAIIFGLAGLFYGWLARRRLALQTIK